MKTIRTFLATALAAIIPLAFTGCGTTGTLTPQASSATSIGTSLAVNAYPGVAPLVQMFAGAVRAATAQGPVAPAALNMFLAPYVTAGEAFVAKVSPKAEADVAKFVAALQADYAKAYPAIVKGDMTVESFAQAVETGA